MQTRYFTVGMLIMAMSVIGSQRPAHAVSETCSGGAYTDTLCPTEGLQPGEYIEDANGRYQMWFDEDGASFIWDTATSSMIRDLSFGPTLEAPDEFVYSPYSSWDGKLVAYNYLDEEDYAIWQYAASPQGEHFVRMDTDGCLRFYDQGGANVRFSYCEA
jgi:hypothetical protein